MIMQNGGWSRKHTKDYLNTIDGNNKTPAAALSPSATGHTTRPKQCSDVLFHYSTLDRVVQY